MHQIAQEEQVCVVTHPFEARNDGKKVAQVSMQISGDEQLAAIGESKKLGAVCHGKGPKGKAPASRPARPPLARRSAVRDNGSVTSYHFRALTLVPEGASGY